MVRFHFVEAWIGSGRVNLNWAVALKWNDPTWACTWVFNATCSHSKLQTIPFNKNPPNEVVGHLICHDATQIASGMFIRNIRTKSKKVLAVIWASKFLYGTSLWIKQNRATRLESKLKRYIVHIRRKHFDNSTESWKICVSRQIFSFVIIRWWRWWRWWRWLLLLLLLRFDSHSIRMWCVTRVW